jgi:hypothetical protein
MTLCRWRSFKAATRKYQSLSILNIKENDLIFFLEIPIDFFNETLNPLTLRKWVNQNWCKSKEFAPKDVLLHFFFLN